jgi:hypothetical protein
VDIPGIGEVVINSIPRDLEALYAIPVEDKAVIVSSEYKYHCIDRLSKTATFANTEADPPCYFQFDSQDFTLGSFPLNGTIVNTVANLDLPFHFDVKKINLVFDYNFPPYCRDYYFEFQVFVGDIQTVSSRTGTNLFVWQDENHRTIVSFFYYIESVGNSERVCIEYDSVNRFSQSVTGSLTSTGIWKNMGKSLEASGGMSYSGKGGCFKYSPGAFLISFYDSTSVNIALEIKYSTDLEYRYLAIQDYGYVPNARILRYDGGLYVDQEHCDSFLNHDNPLPEFFAHHNLSHEVSLHNGRIIPSSVHKNEEMCSFQIPVTTSYLSSDLILPSIERFFFTAIKVVINILYKIFRPLILQVIKQLTVLFQSFLDFLASIDLYSFAISTVVAISLVIRDFKIVNIIIFSTVVFVVTYNLVSHAEN